MSAAFEDCHKLRSGRMVIRINEGGVKDLLSLVIARQAFLETSEGSKAIGLQSQGNGIITLCVRIRWVPR